MGCWSNLKQVLYKLDFFYTAQLLRFRTEPEYRTIFGGLLSVSIIILLLVTFYSKVLDTFNKVIITSSVSATNYNNPTLYTISTMEGKQFMFGVEVWHHNLNQDVRYFDVVLTNVHYDSGEWNDDLTKYIPLEPCTRQHWADYPEVLEGFDRLHVDWWQCLPLNGEYQIEGKYSSLKSQSVEVSISKCTNNSYFDKPCANPADIDTLFQEQENFYYTIYFINPLINSDSTNYLSYYLEDMNYAIFSANAGEECTLMMEDFTITTDQSIIPFAEEKEEKGGIITTKCIKNRYTLDPNDPQALYSTMIIFKSPNSQSIYRSFQKIDEILAYIGGLFGTIAICLFLVNVYNSYSFEILMGENLFKPDDENMRKGLKKYNFLYFLLHLFYMLLNILRCRCCKWKTPKLFYECREEMTKQLDVFYLFKRLVILERGLGSLLSQRQIRALHFFDYPTLEEAKQKRRLYKTNHDSLLYRAANKAESCSEIASKNDKEPDKNSADPHMDPHIPSGNQISVSKGSQPFSFAFNSPSPNLSLKGSKIKKPKFLEEHSQESASESEQDPTQESLKELIALREEAQSSRTSQRIWNQLGDNVKQAVAASQDSFRSELKLVGDNSYGFLADDLDSPTRKNDRKSRLKRHRQLPKINFEDKDVDMWEEKRGDNPQGELEQSGSYFEMEDLSPQKKKSG